MFHSIAQPILARMRHLEQIDARDREDATPRIRRLRQISPDTGRLLALLAAGAPAGACLEIGTSAGYSALWLILGCQASGRCLTTFEVHPDKMKLAQETFRLSEVEACVRLVHGDARDHLDGYSDIAFCFLDAEKDIYGECYELVVPRMVAGGLLVADNVISHSDALGPMLRRATEDERVDTAAIPIGKGLLVCRRV